MDERAYYTEPPATKPAILNCPFCRSAETYELRWMVRKKKDRMPPGADERDRARFAKSSRKARMKRRSPMCARRQANCRRRSLLLCADLRRRSVEIVNAAQRWYVEKLVPDVPALQGLPILSASAPFKCGGRGGPDYYTSVEAGPIAMKNVADLYVYPNGLRVVKVTGRRSARMARTFGEYF